MYSHRHNLNSSGLRNVAICVTAIKRKPSLKVIQAWWVGAGNKKLLIIVAIFGSNCTIERSITSRRVTKRSYFGSQFDYIWLVVLDNVT